MPTAEPPDVGRPTRELLADPPSPLDSCHASTRGPSRHLSPTQHRLLRWLIGLIGLGGLPLVLDAAMGIAQAPNDGLFFLLLPVLATIGWALLIVGLWSAVA